MISKFASPISIEHSIEVGKFSTAFAYELLHGSRAKEINALGDQKRKRGEILSSEEITGIRQGIPESGESIRQQTQEKTLKGTTRTSRNQKEKE